MDTSLIRSLSPGGFRPLVSVVIVCRNQADLLAEAARSAVARSVRVEVIVVDDGSTDRTAPVTRGLDTAMLVRQVNRGLPAARNRGLQSASGEFVIFLDVCDRLLPGGIDAAARALVTNPGCAMAYGRCIIRDADGRTHPMPEMPTVRAGHHAALLRTNLIGPPAVAIFRRAAVLAAGGFVEAANDAAEYDLYLRLSRGAPIHDHGFIVAVCPDRPASNGDAARMLRDTLAVMDRNVPELESELHAAWREGCAGWQELYGLELVDEIHDHVRARAFTEAWRASATLVSLAPVVFFSELRRAVQRRCSDVVIRASEVLTSRRRLRT